MAEFARVIVDLALDRVFDYRIPAALRERVMIGSRVTIPFGHSKRAGYVIGLPARPQVAQVKNILDVDGDRGLIPPKLVELGEWMARYYGCSREQATLAMLPAVVRSGRGKHKTRKVAELASDVDPAEAIAELLEKKRPRQAEVIKMLYRSGPMTQSFLTNQARVSQSVLKNLKAAGYLMITDEVEQRDPFAEMEILPSLPLALTDDQEAAMADVREAFAEEVPRPVLLHGVTGSGKTEIYLQSITICLEMKRTAIVLVPEIALTPQTVERFRGRFGNQVSVLHSRLSDGERFDEWTRINNGEVTIAVGARSALFAPFREVGLIVVDEEHEPSYKQDRAPRYSARDVAVMRGRVEGAVVILGSATPAVESYYNAQRGRYRLSSLPKRVDNAELPKMECVDLGAQPDGQGFLSKRLISCMYEALDQGEQIMLFLNRRGFATKMTCPDCGFVAGCDDCSVSYTYHRKAEHLVCHLCGMVKKAPKTCPECSSGEIRYSGLGTQRIQAAVNAVFSDARTLRMDADTMTRKNSYQEALTAFRSGAVDILIGTQMIAKGLHFPNVTLVGVIFADLSLNIPDFRAAERTFQLLVQVAGRAGRGELPGRVVIQTFTPHNPIIRAAMQQDYEAFYQLEISGRKDLDFPPYRRLLTILLRGPEEGDVGMSAERIAKAVKGQLPDGVTVMGPSPSPLERRRGEYYWFILYVTDNVMRTGHILRHVLRHVHLPKGVRVSIDVDPMTIG